MEIALMILAGLWLLLMIALHGFLLLAMVTWIRRPLRQARLVRALRDGWQMGLLSLGCVLLVSLTMIRDTLAEYPLHSHEGFVVWSMNIADAFSPMGAIAAITILPTGVCWFWERSTRSMDQHAH